MDHLDPLVPFPPVPAGARYGDRELSQLAFNARVLALALDETQPLLERVKFCAIYSGNTDEWVQKRLDLIRQDVDNGSDARGWLSASGQMGAIRAILTELALRQVGILDEILIPALAKEGIELLHVDQLDDDDRAHCAEVFDERMFPILTPLAIDQGRPFPHISTLSMNLAVRLQLRDGGWSLARVKIPHQLKRFVVLPQRAEGAVRLVPTEQVIAAHLDRLFPSVTVAGHGLFRVTRHAHQAFAEEEAEDLLETIESGLLERRFGKVVRIEASTDCPDELLQTFIDELEVDLASVVRIPGLLNLDGLWQLAGLDRPDLSHRSWTPQVPTSLRRREDMWSRIRAGDVLVHHPYDSFEHTTQGFIEAAAADPKVVAIKLTIYRTTGTDSPIVAALIRAAEAGKQTVALVELKARFDEEANISRARNLESAGVHVVYGLIGLKTHTKTCLVVREENGRLRRYAHIGTGNYNPATATIYEDIGVFTARPEVGADLSQLFNMLTGYSANDVYPSLLVAPTTMRAGLLQRIRGETAAGPDGRIIIKCNNLVDREIIDALYEASQAGVPVDLIIRSMCAILPGVPGLSDTIRVRSIVGRFLEHSRIFRFGTPERGMDYLIGSADMMSRNLDRRVEAIVPVTDLGNRAHLQQILDVQLADAYSAWVLSTDGRWQRSVGDPATEAHTVMQDQALQRASG
ncbi:RNA degradosome polyphosphate kinase [soil metagenome]